MINWKLRYAALFELQPALADPNRHILEVGSGSEGIARYLKRSVVGVDRSFAAPFNRWLHPVRGSILGLPFSDRAFDDVVCVDTLEHLDRGDRPRAIAELVRVAASRVILSGPVGGFAEWGDASYAEHIARRPRRVLPEWLQQHLVHGIPSLGDMLEALVGCGHRFTVGINEGVIQHYAALFADNYAFMARFQGIHEDKFALEAPLARAKGDVPYSYLIAIDVAAGPAKPPEEPECGEPRAAAPSRAGRAEIFAVGHRLDRMPEIPGVRRLLAGAGAGSRPGAGSGILCDDGGDSIAHRNADFSEMTAIYWVWRNVTGLDGVGFCHYRRYFDFRADSAASRRETRLATAHDVTRHRSHFVDPSVVARTLETGAIIVTRTTEERMANAEQYMVTHVPDHYLAMLNHLLARYPYLARQLIAHVRDDGFYGNNMFVMRWADFDRLCRFWFDCLFALDRQIDARPAGYQRRVLAFLSERLFDIHVRWLRDCGRQVVEYPLFFLEEPALAGER